MALRLIRNRARNERPLALLDLGSSKVACLIVTSASGEPGEARIGEALPAHVLGFGLTRSRGIRSGAVSDLAQAEEAIKKAVGDAEADAGIRVDSIVVAVTSGRLQSLNFAASAKPAGESIVSADIEKMLDAGKAYAERDGRSLLHLQRLGFRLDGEAGIRNPRGLKGERLSLELNAVTADEAVLRNIRLLLGRSYLTVSAFVAAPYASALATLAEEDFQGATAVIDFGAGTTTFSVFRDGLFQQAGGLALGGHLITQDIARSLGFSLVQAERIKALYGNLAGALSDEHEFIPLTHGQGTPPLDHKLTRADLRRIVAPRVEEMLQLVRERIASSGGKQGPERVVLTGGGSQLAGLGDMVARRFGGRVRAGWPKALAGLDREAATPGLSALLGLGYAALVPGAMGRSGEAKSATPAGYVGRLGRWFKDSFWDDEEPQDAGRA